jgi:hypothetical protein
MPTNRSTVHNSGTMSVGGAMVVGSGNHLGSAPAPPTPAPTPEEVSLGTLLPLIQAAAVRAGLAGPALGEVVGGTLEAQRCLNRGETAQVRVALLRTYAALDPAQPGDPAAELRQMLETAARIAMEMDG